MCAAFTKEKRHKDLNTALSWLIKTRPDSVSNELYFFFFLYFIFFVFEQWQSTLTLCLSVCLCLSLSLSVCLSVCLSLSDTQVRELLGKPEERDIITIRKKYYVCWRHAYEEPEACFHSRQLWLGIIMS